MSMLNLFKSTIIVVFRNIYVSLIRVPISIAYIIYKFRSKSTHYMVVCDHIGDTLLCLGYINAYRNQYGIKHLTFVTTKGMISLVEGYGQFFDNTIILPKKCLKLILDSGKTNFGGHVIKRLDGVTIVNPENAFTSEFFLYPSRFPMMSLKDCIKYGELHLESDAKFIAPYFQHNCNGVIKKLNVKKGKTVILTPYAVVTQSIPFSFFDRLSELLFEQGFQIMTNITDPEQRVAKESRPLRCSLEEAVSIAEYCGWVIGLRSGILDLLCYARCHIIALYPSDNCYTNFFRLSALEGIAADVIEYLLSNEKYDLSYLIDCIEQRRAI